MKKYIFFLVSIFIILSCNGNKENIPQPTGSIVGEWVLSSYSTKSVSIGTESIDVYIKFDKSSFEMYQKLGAGRYTYYSGTYTLSKDILSGKYSDGKSWASQYSVSFDNKKITLTQYPDPKEIQTFTSTTIPESVKNNIY